MAMLEIGAVPHNGVDNNGALRVGPGRGSLKPKMSDDKIAEGVSPPRNPNWGLPKVTDNVRQLIEAAV